MSQCPKCNFQNNDNSTECSNCGIIFSKYERHQINKNNESKNPPTKPSVQKNNNSTKSKPSAIVIVGGGFILFCVFIAIFGEMIGLKKSPPSTATVLTNTTTANQNQSEWLPAASNIWQGVKLYSGNGHNKAYVGQVIAWSESYTIPGTGEKIRAIQIQMHDSSIEWKDRGYIIRNTFVKRDDPALK